LLVPRAQQASEESYQLTAKADLKEELSKNDDPAQDISKKNALDKESAARK
jgi:hypothetical protein